MKSTVYQLFIEAVDRLIFEKKAKNKKEIAESLEISPSYFSGILNGGIKINAEIIQLFLNKWPVNPSWMSGQSDIFYNYSKDNQELSLVHEPKHDYENASRNEPSSKNDCNLCSEKDRLIQQQSETIKTLNEVIVQLKENLKKHSEENH